MAKRTLVMGGMVAGLILGSLVPSLWGGHAFSLLGVLSAALGGTLGILAVYLAFF